MDCHACKEVNNLAVNTSNCRLCDQCYYKYDPKHSDSETIVNDVIFHLYHNRMRGTYSCNAESCEKKFGYEAVAAAGEYLLNKVKDKLDIVDASLSKKLATRRRESGGRTKVSAIICDIHATLVALETGIKVFPANVKNIVSINPESLLPEAVDQRLTKIECILTSQEALIKTLQRENIEL